ncbi:MAG: hypothetical protein ACYCV4_05495 [Dermatophilaceae bacterium]
MSAFGLRASTGAMFAGPSSSSSKSVGGASVAAYGPMAKGPEPAIFNPTHGHGAGFWLRAGLIVLVLHMYYTAPR